MTTATPTRTRPITTPAVVPQTEPVRRYRPDPDHCGEQITRSVRRIRRVFEP